MSRLQHIQDLNSALHGLLQKTCTTPTNVSNSELEQFQQKVKDQDYFYETIAMLSTHVQSIKMELQHLGAQVGAALLLTDFNPEYFPQWDIEKRTAHPLTTAINNASRDTVYLPGFNDVYDQFDVAFNEEDVKIPLEDKPSSDNLVRKLRDIVPVLETDDRKMSRRSHSKMPKKEVENTDEGTMMNGEMPDHESLQPKLKYTTGRHAKKYEILKGKTKFYFVLHMIKNGEKRTHGSTTIHAHHMVPHFAVMFFDSRYTLSRCAWRCKTTHLFGFRVGFVAYIAGNLEAPPAAMFLRFEAVEQVLTKSEQQHQ